MFFNSIKEINRLRKCFVVTQTNVTQTNVTSVLMKLMIQAWQKGKKYCFIKTLVHMKLKRLNFMQGRNVTQNCLATTYVLI